MDLNSLMIYTRNIPERKASYAPFPESLSSDMIQYLTSHGVKNLYTHQAEMFDKARQGNNVVITTSTASGKTLSFLLPVLQEILENPTSRAIFIYPTKALASDQYRAIQPYIEYFGEDRIMAGVYDGDTPVSERNHIRKNANIILTNPEMINGAFLPNHSKYNFDFIFSNLKYVVIDELHTYRGAFGSHLANVFRRFSRVCEYYHVAPQFLCSSATIANPLELAENICGKSFELVDNDGSPAGEKTYIFMQPPKIMGKDNRYYGQASTTSVAATLLPELMENGKSYIAFAKSRRNVEVVLKETRDQLDSEIIFGKSLMNKVSGYRGGYTAMERKEIERRMISGELMGLVSTNALELGIDIGKIDATVIVGYPGTKASFWQQTGRSGRSGKRSTNYLILEQMPFDQYIGIHPEWLFEQKSESAVIDKNNLLIELSHIRAAAAELPLTLDDISRFPDLGETIPVLMNASELAAQNGKFVWNGNSFPAGDISLRNIDQARYKLLLKDSYKEVTEMDEMQAFRELHKGAVYMHDGLQYEVTELNLETRTAMAIPFKGNYYTVPGGETNIRVIQNQKQEDYHRTQISFGDINVDECVYMFKKLQFHNHQNLGFEQLEKPLSKDYDTESTWIRIPENVVKVYRSLLQETPNGKMVHQNHFEGLCHAILNAALMFTMTEQEDIGTCMSGNAVGSYTEEGDTVYLYIYDKYVGGLGYAEKIYDLVPDIIQHAIELVGGCTCENGCIVCVGDYNLDKKMVLWGLQNLLEEQEAPKDIKMVEYAKATFVKKAFSFAKLGEQWQDFCQYLEQNGEKYAAFLSTIPQVEIMENRVLIQITNAFYKEWIMQPQNQTAIINILTYYTDGKGISLDVEVKQQDGHHKEIQRKLQKRYEDMAHEDGTGIE